MQTIKHRLVQNVTYKLFVYKLFIFNIYIYIYKQDLTLNNLQELIYPKTWPTNQPTWKQYPTKHQLYSHLPTISQTI